MQSFLLALLTAPLFSATASTAATQPALATSVSVVAGRTTTATELPSWFKRKKRHTPAYRRLRRR